MCIYRCKVASTRRISMKTCNLGIILLVLIMAAVSVGNSPVSADSCNVQTSSLAYVAPYYDYNYNSGIIVPVSATCSFVGGQLYAVGEATDASNARAGSANTVLFSAFGTTIYTGQLVFRRLGPSSNVPEFLGRSLRISISIYSGVYNGPYSNASPLTTSVETVQVNSNDNYMNYANCHFNNNCDQIYNYCHSPSSNSQAQCVGYLYQDPNGCVELVIPVYSVYGVVSYQYYTLQKLPASYPAIGTWVSVTGQISQGNNFSSTGASCPGNYINVASIN
jgi:hypothetical protein